MTKRTDFRLGAIGKIMLAAISMFGLAASIFPPGDMIDTLRSMTFASSIAVVIAFTPPAWQALFERPASKASILAMGIWCSWFAVANGSLQIIMGYELGQMWVFRSLWNAATAAITLSGAVCHLLAPRAIGDTIPPRAWVYLGTIIGMGVLVVLLLIEAKTVFHMPGH